MALQKVVVRFKFLVGSNFGVGNFGCAQSNFEMDVFGGFKNALSHIAYIICLIMRA